MNRDITFIFKRKQRKEKYLVLINNLDGFPHLTKPGNL